MSEALPARIGKYPVVRELARGATSRVYLGRDPFANRDVAIKVVRAEPEADTDTRRRFDRAFLNEAALVGRLMHPHIMQIYDADATDEYSYIVMEYVEGPTLEHYCDISRLMPIERVVEIAFKCSLALDFAQRHGVIHRDIKPANILLGPGNEIKISDFGAAKLDSAEHTLLQGIGSPAYMSPEQVLERELTPQTDIYSLGVVMYQLLTGRLPFVASNKASLLYQIVHIDAAPPSLHRADLPPALDDMVRKAMAKDLKQRFQSWAEFSRALTRTYRHLELPADAIGETEKFNTIRSLAFFRDLRDIEIWEILRLGAWRRHPPEKTVITEGDVGESFYVIVEGECRVTKAGKLLDTLRSGDCFGELLYFEETRARRVTTITASSGLTVIEIKAQAVRQASDGLQKQINKAFLRILIDRLTWANSRLSARND
ncbi:MAG TPA: serine/threonine-protein kinase [Burkholderiales bacterium]|jgi:serine/threonine protein kinase|nr:serine/threonine-protein kinase [Burkholderiales bacterium]